jgi:copper transport protein
MMIVLLLISEQTVFAHANLLRSDPPGNASLDQAPAEIRLWFSEALEPEFSSISLRDSQGQLVNTPPSIVDAGDPAQMVMQPGELPEGLYTVTWRVLSTDGHSTEGSFAFGIGVPVTTSSTIPLIDETVPPESAAIRWFSLLSMSLAVGSVAFWLFVWKPSASQTPAVERRLRLVMALGWLLLGLSSLLSLLLQVSTAAQVSVLDAIGNPAFGGMLFNSRYGQIWLARMAWWLLMGSGLWMADTKSHGYWLALVFGLLVLLTTSLYSHASATQQDTTAAIMSDWLHLIASAFWIGGLIPFFVVMGSGKFSAYVEKALTPNPRGGSEAIFLPFALRAKGPGDEGAACCAPTKNVASTGLSTLTGHFSNFARVAVFSLIVSGLYSAWLHVGSVEALTTTVYGQALLVKLLLVLPLLLIAAVNLLVTNRRLREGQAIWAGRLRGLVGAEIALTIGILAAVGIMTAIAPARTVMAVRVAASRQPQIQPFFEMQMQNDLMAHLEIVPGVVGENEFLVSLYNEEGHVITDASRIRLRFESLEQNLGESELRPELRDDGIFYAATGANLSIPGEWRIRMTVQRPQQFDTVLDFHPTLSASLPPPPTVESAIPAGERGLAAALAGIGLLGVGGFFLAQKPRALTSGSSLLSGAALAVGVILLVTSVSALRADTSLRTRDAWARPMLQGMTGSVYLTIENNTPQLERLIGADTDVAASVELHQTVIENQIASMRFVPGLDIPAYSQLAIETGDYHLMLNDLQQDLTEGETFPLTLHFASGAFITVEVTVREG